MDWNKKYQEDHDDYMRELQYEQWRENENEQKKNSRW